MGQQRSFITVLLLFLVLSYASQLLSAPGEDGIAICVASNVQYRPSIAPAGGGSSVIVWQDYRNGTADIYAQKINAAGSAFWTSDGLPVCTADGSQYYPTATSDGAGGAIITWYDSRAGEYDIYAQRVSSSGSTLWTSGGVPICSANGSQENPQIASDGAGGAIIVWRDMRNGNYDLYAQRVNANGNCSWSSNGIPLCDAPNSQYQPAMISCSGGVMLAWPDERSGNLDIYAQKLLLNGNGDWTSNGVALCTNTSKQNHVQLTSDGAGGAIVVWRDKRPGLTYDIYTQRVDANGSIRWTNDGVAVCTADNDQNSPTIITDGAGGAIMAWEDERVFDFNIYAQKVDANGNLNWTGNGIAICSANSSQYNPRAVTDGAGGAIIGWEDYRSGNWDIYSQRVNGGGSIQWTSNGINICGSSGTQYEICMVSNGANGATYTWTDERAGYSDPNIYTNTVDGNGSFEVPTAVKTYFATLDGNAVKIQWELSEAGLYMQYTIWRADGPTGDFAMLSAPEIEQEGMTLTCIDRTAEPDHSYRYRIDVSDEEGYKTLFETGPITVPGIAVTLYQNQPNPFNPATTISFSLPRQEAVRLTVIDAAGRLVKTLVSDPLSPGLQQAVWDGTDANGSPVSSGVYFYRLRAGKTILTKKMILVK